jgi:hypothetical protein
MDGTHDFIPSLCSSQLLFVERQRIIHWIYRVCGDLNRLASIRYWEARRRTVYLLAGRFWGIRVVT